ncbi:hypothetical protein B5S32_g2385 [[Candida] boidinii]|nr:hypothetical protein B5S32_g2385 [[Candida] boidinii]
MIRSGYNSLTTIHKSKLITGLLVASSAVLLNQYINHNNINSIQKNSFSSMSFKEKVTIKPPQAPPVWNHTPESIAKDTEILIKKATDLDDQIAANLDSATIDSVIKPYAQLENEQAFLINQLSFYQHVSASKELRDASNASDEKFRAYSIEAGLREDVFKSINKVYNETKDSTDLDKETSRFISKVNKQYQRNGLALPIEKREKIKEIKQKLSTLALKFSKNLGEETEHILYKTEELSGVPKDVIDQFEIVEKDGVSYHKMTFKYPDLFPVLKYASNPETRKRSFIGDQNKVPENADILIEAVKLRAQLANLLGYKNFSEYILEERMAKNPENVMNFLIDLKQKLKPLGEKEIVYLKDLKLKDLKEKSLPTDDTNYYVWDHRYYHTKMLETDYKVDEQKISEYFPMQSTVEKMLAIFEHIFKLQFVETPKEEASTWHEDVKQFAVWKLDNPESPEFVGWLYFDLHPREGKYGHAANFGIAPGYTKSDGSRSYPVTSLVCNFSKPTKEKPSLLKHDEVTTFFHELGHGIHDLLGKTTYSRFSGTSVSWDFVECPSQMLEYWTWSANELKGLSSHYLEPSKKLPDDLIDSLVKSKNVNGALFNLRQLHFGLFDMTLHTSSTGEDVDILKAWNEMREEIALVSNGGISTKGFGSFGHLLGGYASGYYGYLWSQVFAADIFYSKFKADPMSTESGLQYRDIILGRGGSREEMENLEDLLKRKPNSDAFLQELGVN